MRDAPSPRTFLNQAEAADLLRLSARTLERLRAEGGGPPFRRFGRRVVYSLHDLYAWADVCRRTSTADPGNAGESK